MDFQTEKKTIDQHDSAGVNAAITILVHTCFGSESL